jgi:hypothetical protein
MWMQPKLLAAQRKEVEAKFSLTWKVGRDVDQHIRWGVAPLDKWVRREVPHARSSSSSLAHLVSTRLDTSWRARAPRFAELGLGAELIFLLHRKTERLTESLMDTSQLACSGRSRIVGCCNRLGRATWAWPTLSMVSPLRRLYKLLPGYRRTHPETDLGFLPPLAACTASVVYSIPSAGVHQRTGEQVSGTTRPCDPVRERAN